MNRLHTHANDAERRDAAAAWLVRLDAPDASEADWLSFETWLGDPDNKRALDGIEAAMALVDDHREEFRNKPARATSRPLFLRLGWIALFASAAAAVLFFQWRTPPSETFAFEAPPQATRTITLADGSGITLNRGASLRLRWSVGERHADLLRGEAAFQVVHNDNAPFVVAVGAVTVRDVGTEFNVRRETSALTITVRTGAVNFSAAGRALDMAPGDQAIFAGGRVQVRRVDPDAVMAWRQGRLVYHDAALSDVITDLNKYGDRPIRLGDSQTGRLRFSGVLQIGSAAAMTSELEAFLPVRSEHNGSGIVIRSRTSQGSSRP